MTSPSSHRVQEQHMDHIVTRAAVQYIIRTELVGIIVLIYI
jgi:hypothetical protein